MLRCPGNISMEAYLPQNKKGYCDFLSHNSVFFLTIASLHLANLTL